MTEVKSNTYNYTRKKLSADQVLVTNNLGYTVVYGEFVVLGGYFGFVEEPGGIANGATGYISIMPFEVSSEQVEATDTFTAGNTLYFEPGSGVAGTFVDTATGTTTAVGIITGEVGTGGAQTAVSFVPFLQRVNNSGLDTRLSALEVNAVTAQACILVALGSIMQEDGTPLGQVSGTTSGFEQLSNAEQVIDIPVNATIEALGFTVPVPQDLDDSEDIVVHVLAGKSADNDALTLDCEVFPCAAGDTGNADIQDTAAQTVTQAAVELTFTCGADGVLAAPGTLSVILTLGGTNDGDAVYIYGAWIEYTKKVLTS